MSTCQGKPCTIGCPFDCPRPSQPDPEIERWIEEQLGDHDPYGRLPRWE